jgi:predicted GIY-YIG superfamily endonuclease
MAKNHHLVIEHLENIGAEVFEKYAPVITRFVDRRNGIYALYRGTDLYYVGLARNLKGRLKDHLRDRHAGAWDRFSVYLTQGDRFLKEMESLLLRISLPEGNRVKGKLRGSRDLKRELQQAAKAQMHEELSGLIGRAPVKENKAKKSAAVRDTRTIHLRRDYKGKVYRATWRPDGTVKMNGRIYTSVSAAGRAVTKRGTNGRLFWWARNEHKEWVSLHTLGW